MRAYLQSLGDDVWEIVESGYHSPSSIPTDDAWKKQYETNAKPINTLFGNLAESKFVKLMQLNTKIAIRDKIIRSYEGDSKIKSTKLQMFRIKYDTLRMHDYESIARFFLRLDEIVNSMRNLYDKVKDSMVVEKILRSLTPKFNSKFYVIKEMQDLKNLTIEQLHGILTAYEMRKGGPSDIKEATLKATYKGKEKEELKETSYKEEANSVKKLQVGIGKFRGKLTFNFFSYGRVGRYAPKCPFIK